MNADGSGATILNYLIKNNNLETVQTVVKYAGDINFTNKSDSNNNIYPLLNAIIYEKYNIFNFLIEKDGSLMTSQPLYNNAKTYILDLLFYIYPDFAQQVKHNTKLFMKSVLKSYKKMKKILKKYNLI